MHIINLSLSKLIMMKKIYYEFVIEGTDYKTSSGIDEFWGFWSKHLGNKDYKLNRDW